jgi:hypothetical protein
VDGPGRQIGSDALAIGQECAAAAGGRQRNFGDLLGGHRHIAESDQTRQQDASNRSSQHVTLDRQATFSENG